MIKNKSNYRVGIFLASVSYAVVLSNGQALSQESSVDFGFSADASYNDNRYLSPTNKQSVYVFNVRPTVDFIIADEGSTTILSARGSYAFSSDQAVQEDRATYGGGIEGNYQFEYSTLSIGAGYDRQSIFDTEFEDTGQFIRNQTRDRGYANFSYATELTERWVFRVSDNFQISDYSTTIFNNYWSNQVGVGLDYELNETTSVVQNGSYLRYVPENDLAPRINSYSYLIGISHQLSENTTITVTGGSSYVNDTYRWSAIAELVYEMENNQFSFRAAREIRPSGVGGLLQSESVAFGTTFNYSEGTNMGLDASWRRQKGITTIFAVDREFIGVSPWVSFEVFEDLRLRFSYELRRQRIGLTNDWGISNGFVIAIVY